MSIANLIKQQLRGNLSLNVVLALISMLFIYRITHIDKKEISWDVLGYYMPLPATFVHHDPLLNSTDWLQKVNEEKQLTGTLYMVSTSPTGEPMYFFFLGMSLFYLPFFCIAHILAYLFGFPMDGFSDVYTYSLVFGAVVYTAIGLWYLRKILKFFFNEQITSIVLLVTVLGTNYIQHLTLKNLETVNVLFMLVCVVIWYTIQWHKHPKLKYLCFIGLAITCIALVKPSEILVLFIPLLWKVQSFESAKIKWKLLWQYRVHLLLSIGLCVLVASPQMLYWFIKTGRPIYDSYKNPGVGLDVFSPHLFETLFSYRKGWLIYTPVMVFYLLGLFFLYQRNKSIALASIAYFCLSFYVIASWSEWWYGAGYSNRPLIVTYSILALGFGYFLTHVFTLSKTMKISVGIVLMLCVAINQFQWWQFKQGILDPYRTTKEYYWQVFLKTKATDEAKQYLRIERNFEGEMALNKQEMSFSYTLNTLDGTQGLVQVKDSAETYYQIPAENEFAWTNQIKYKRLTGLEYAWIEVSLAIRVKDTLLKQTPCMVFTMDRKEGNYGYYAPEIKLVPNRNEWHTYTFTYLTPEIRSREDDLKMYIWNRGKRNLDVKDFKVTVFQK